MTVLGPAFSSGRDFLFGTSGQQKERSKLTGGQNDLLDFLLESILSGTGPFGFDEESFQRDFVDPAMRQFETRTAPAIQQKAISRGTVGSSGLDKRIADAGADVQSNLDVLRGEMKNNQLDRILKGAALGLGTDAFGFEQEEGQAAALPLILSLLGGYVGGPGGSAAGKAVGEGVSSIFRS